MSVRTGCKPKIPLKFELLHPNLALTLSITIPTDYPGSSFTYELRTPSQNVDGDAVEFRSDDFDRISEELRVFYDSQISIAPETLTVVSLAQQFIRSDSSASIVQDPNVPLQAVPALGTPGASYTCHKCRCLLFTAEEIEPHNLLAKSKLCSSIFLNEPTEWMQDVSEVEGKISCPRCGSRVGSYCWAGLMCSCGGWVTPAIKFTNSKIDLKLLA